MRFTQAFLAALSVAATQAVIITNGDFSGITVGTPFVITYSDAVGPVTVYLGTGDPTNVIQGNSVGTSSGATGSISWTPTSGGSFALKIVDAGAPNSATNPNFSGFFSVAGPVVGGSTTSIPTGVSSTTSSVVVSTTTSSVVVPTTTVMTTPVNNGTTTIITSTSTKNGTTSISTGTSTSTSSTGTGTTVPTQVPNSMAAGIASPLAFVMLAVGALLTFN